jgi:hypothetical protein
VSAATAAGDVERHAEDARDGPTASALAPYQATLAPYQAIYAHAEHELELAGRGELADITALGARWDELIAGLPAQPPRAAAELLEHARLLHERTRVELLRLREALLAELSGATRARRAVDGYAGQLRRRPRLDRSA